MSTGDSQNPRGGRDRLTEAFEAMDCTGVLEDVWLMIDDECDDSTRQRVQQHLLHCPSCLEMYGIETKVRELLSKKCCERAPEGLRARLEIEIRQISRTIEQ